MGSSLPRYCTTTMQQKLLSACCSSTLPVSQLQLNQFGENQSEPELWHSFIIVLLWQIKKRGTWIKKCDVLSQQLATCCVMVRLPENAHSHLRPEVYDHAKSRSMSAIITQHFLTVAQTSRLQLVSIHFSFTRWRHDAAVAWMTWESNPPSPATRLRMSHWSIINGLVSESRLKPIKHTDTSHPIEMQTMLQCHRVSQTDCECGEKKLVCTWQSESPGCTWVRCDRNVNFFSKEQTNVAANVVHCVICVHNGDVPRSETTKVRKSIDASSDSVQFYLLLLCFMHRETTYKH